MDKDKLVEAVVALADGADKCANAPLFLVQPFIEIYRKHGHTIAAARAAALRSHCSEMSGHMDKGAPAQRSSMMSVEAYARWASRALNRLSGGGSEMFIRLADGEFYADPDMAVQRAQGRIDTIRRLHSPVQPLEPKD